MNKKVICLMLVLTMLLGAMPMQVMAVEENNNVVSSDVSDKSGVKEKAVVVGVSEALNETKSQLTQLNLVGVTEGQKITIGDKINLSSASTGLKYIQYYWNNMDDETKWGQMGSQFVDQNDTSIIWDTTGLVAGNYIVKVQGMNVPDTNPPDKEVIYNIVLENQKPIIIFSASNSLGPSQSFYGNYGSILDGNVSASADGGRFVNDGDYWYATNRYIDSGQIINFDNTYTLSLSAGGWAGIYNLYVGDKDGNWYFVGSVQAPITWSFPTKIISFDELPIKDIRYFRASSPAGGNRAALDSFEVTVTSTNISKSLTLTGIKEDDKITIGTKVPLSATSKGLKYVQYYYKNMDDGSAGVSMHEQFIDQTETTVTWDTTGLVPGNYIVKVQGMNVPDTIPLIEIVYNVVLLQPEGEVVIQDTFYENINTDIWQSFDDGWFVDKQRGASNDGKYTSHWSLGGYSMYSSSIYLKDIASKYSLKQYTMECEMSCSQGSANGFVLNDGMVLGIDKVWNGNQLIFKTEISNWRYLGNYTLNSNQLYKLKVEVNNDDYIIYIDDNKAAAGTLYGATRNSSVGLYMLKLDGNYDYPYFRNFKLTLKNQDLEVLKNPPTVVTKDSTNVTDTTAILNGVVTAFNIDGENTKEVGFKYCIKGTGDYTTVIAGTTTDKSTGYSLKVEGLKPNTDYSYIAYAVNSAGEGKSIEPKYFKTKEEVQKLTLSGVKENDIFVIGTKISLISTSTGLKYISYYYKNMDNNTKNIPINAQFVDKNDTSVSLDTKGFVPGNYTLKVQGSNVLGQILKEVVYNVKLLKSNEVTTLEATKVEARAVRLNGKIKKIEASGEKISEYGFSYCVKGTGNYITKIVGSEIKEGDTFSFDLSGLTPNTEYSYYAYAKNSQGISNTTSKYFKTLKLLNPRVIINSPTINQKFPTGDISFKATGENCDHIYVFMKDESGTEIPVGTQNGDNFIKTNNIIKAGKYTVYATASNMPANEAGSKIANATPVTIKVYDTPKLAITLPAEGDVLPMGDIKIIVRGQNCHHMYVTVTKPNGQIVPAGTDGIINGNVGELTFKNDAAGLYKINARGLNEENDSVPGAKSGNALEVKYEVKTTPSVRIDPINEFYFTGDTIKINLKTSFANHILITVEDSKNKEIFEKSIMAKNFKDDLFEYEFKVNDRGIYKISALATNYYSNMNSLYEKTATDKAIFTVYPEPKIEISQIHNTTYEINKPIKYSYKVTNCDNWTVKLVPEVGKIKTLGVVSDYEKKPYPLTSHEKKDIEFTPTDDGNYKLLIEGNNTNDTNDPRYKSVNELISFKVLKPADLIIENISWKKVTGTRNEIFENEEINFIASIKNIGDGATEEGTKLKVNFFLDNVLVAESVTENSIDSNESRWVTANANGINNTGAWIAKVGSYKLTARVELLDANVPEKNTGNNESNGEIDNAKIEVHEKPVIVKYNGVVVDEECYLKDGETWVPIEKILSVISDNSFIFINEEQSISERFDINKYELKIPGIYPMTVMRNGSIYQFYRKFGNIYTIECESKNNIYFAKLGDIIDKLSSKGDGEQNLTFKTPLEFNKESRVLEVKRTGANFVVETDLLKVKVGFINTPKIVSKYISDEEIDTSFLFENQDPVWGHEHDSKTGEVLGGKVFNNEYDVARYNAYLKRKTGEVICKRVYKVMVVDDNTVPDGGKNDENFDAKYEMGLIKGILLGIKSILDAEFAELEQYKNEFSNKYNFNTSKDIAELEKDFKKIKIDKSVAAIGYYGWGIYFNIHNINNAIEKNGGFVEAAKKDGNNFMAELSQFATNIEKLLEAIAKDDKIKGKLKKRGDLLQLVADICAMEEPIKNEDWVELGRLSLKLSLDAIKMIVTSEYRALIDVSNLFLEYSVKIGKIIAVENPQLARDIITPIASNYANQIEYLTSRAVEYGKNKKYDKDYSFRKTEYYLKKQRELYRDFLNNKDIEITMILAKFTEACAVYDKLKDVLKDEELCELSDREIFMHIYELIEQSVY